MKLNDLKTLIQAVGDVQHELMVDGEDVAPTTFEVEIGSNRVAVRHARNLDPLTIDLLADNDFRIYVTSTGAVIERFDRTK
ncbi:hypothetical protein [Adlercreutzia agrestimuris]|uniref:hypothetical protein n=1 Tax=Adlercreutzia agrestimuris TaxID=2941324 RepID=UPI00203E90CA|nr:hypothetical protein [Adlercreutzia agrestimuris]